jgi:hypothetical protein
MRNVKWLIVVGTALATTGCVESMDQGYPSGAYDNGGGYANGYYASESSGYYSQPSYYSPARVTNNYYYTPAPRVVTETRYVPVPTPAPAARPHQADRSNDQRWDGHRDGGQQHASRPQNTPPQTSTPPANRPQASSNRNGNRRPDQDRDGDGKPDRRS